MKKAINRITAVLLVLAMVLFSNSARIFTKAQEAQMSESNKKMVCNSADNSASLFIDENGHFVLKNNITNKSWYSIPQNPEKDNISAGITVNDTRSELLIEYILREDVNTQYSSQKSNSESMCNNNAIKVTEIKNGFRVLYNFKKIGIKIPVEYKFVDSGFEASVIIDEIDEGKKSFLVSLDFLPYFGAGNHEESGYLFIPDGSGAIAEFNKNIKPVKSYEKRVYGDDLAHSNEAKTSKEYDIKLPVFGIVTGGNGLMGVITEGDGAASIKAKTGSDDVFYNSVSSKMIYRICTKDNALYKKDRQGSTDGNYIYTLTSTEFGLKRYTVKYYMLADEEANYSGMARKYKEYLAEKYGLNKKESAAKLGIRAYGAVEEEKNFLGIPYYKKKALTTYDQMEEILNDLTENGVKNVAVQYVGWTGNGVTNRSLPLSIGALSVLGGKNKLKSLLNYSKEENINLYLDNDILYYKKSGNGVSVRRDAAKAPSGDTAKIYDYSMVTFLQDTKVDPSYLLSMRKLGKSLNMYVEHLNKFDIDCISFSTLGNTLYSDFKAKTGIYRAKSVSILQKQLKGLSQKYRKLALSDSNAYAIPFSEQIFDTPMASSGYDIFAYDIPFYQMVVNGFTSYTTSAIIQSVDYDAMILKAIETGSDLLFDCVYVDSSEVADTELSGSYSSQYKSWKEKAIKSYKEIEDINIKLNGSNIKEHSRIANDVYCTVYENGIKIIVNYSSDEISADGITVKGKSYAVAEA